LLVALILAFLVYLPAGQLLARIAAPSHYLYDTPPFARYDVVLVNQWAYALTSPRRGDIVQFRPMNFSRQRVGNEVLHVRYVLEEDAVIDRIIGLPGDRVIWNDGRVSINGKTVAWTPLLPERLPKHLEMTVPAGLYMVLPTASVGAVNPQDAESFWKYGSMIPAENILGRAYLRVSPIAKYWFMY
jgi:signal peptidase I